MRKGESWRLRVLPADSRDATAVLGRLTSTLTQRAVIRHAESVIYESGTRRFGGPEVMRAAHDLFHADSRHILARLAYESDDHRRELGGRQDTRMMLAAGQDLYQQGDVWARIAEPRGGGASELGPESEALTGRFA
ncbi:thiopeptide-type bacteriocin biosynthesis protein [Streptomyces sp. NBC_01003]|uniref:thiopeptide-type bacteriocin biosynthesis protein n=1 Tax=Streptomyces sp. NBC_01003 TaxID=2903714 RepID=UPI003869A149|nr:thiopeptide-type bacteriocin biosynthesis protein [Streptomyces sp. NBC_01003]